MINMERKIEFHGRNGKYYLTENNQDIFQISSSDMRFDSLKFYQGVYEDKMPLVALDNRLPSDDLDVSSMKTGNYIFGWMEQLIQQINQAFADEKPIEPLTERNSDDKTEPDTTTDFPHTYKDISLYDLAVCAGNGDFLDHPGSEMIPTDNPDADYALKIAGKSMEPTIFDGDTVLVKKTEELNHKDIGIFLVDEVAMCKRFIKKGRGYRLVPDNPDPQYDCYEGKILKNAKILGKVVDIIHKETG